MQSLGIYILPSRRLYTPAECVEQVESFAQKIQKDLILNMVQIYVTQLRSGEDPELRNTLKNASYRGGRAAKCFKYSPTEGDGGVRAIRSSPG